MIRLYDRKREEVTLLSIPRQLDILHMYIEALYEVRNFRKLKREVHPLIYLSLSEEIPVEVGRPYYEDALFWKANASLELMEYKDARHILEQLIRINPKKKEYRRSLVRCLYLDKPNYIRQLRAFSVLLFLVSALLAITEILIFRNFYTEHLALTELLRNGMFIAALVIVFGAELIHWLLCEYKVKRI